MNRWTTWLVRGLALAALAVAGCAQERAPINRVQPNALDKSFFVGPKLDDDVNGLDKSDNPEFYARGFVIDESPGQNGLSVGLYTGMDRIKWQITEDYLIARKSYQLAKGQTHPDFGVVVAKYKITSHFDIKRAYNPQTGEDLNIVEENTTDRPWQERQYMRVDWSTNEVQDPMWEEMFLGKIFGDMTVEPLTYTITDPNSEDAPHFETKDGYFDVTNKYFVAPETTSLWGQQVPTCILVGLYTGTTTKDCNAQEATVRFSFWKVNPNDDFIPMENTKRKMDVVANFGGAGSSFEPGFAGGTTQCWDPQYAYTDACFHQYLAKYNLWEKSHADIACTSDADTDHDGTADQCAGYKGSHGSQCDTYYNKCTLPLRDRVLKPVGYWLNKETPTELLDPVDAHGVPTSPMVGADGKPASSGATFRVPTFRGAMEDVVKSWNQLLTGAIAYGREAECRRTGDGDRPTCHQKYFVTDSSGNDVLQMVAFGGWGVPIPKVLPNDGPAVLVACHAPVRDYDYQTTCGQVTTQTCDVNATTNTCGPDMGCNAEGHCADVARSGDQRKNFIFYWPWDSDAHYGGVAGLGQDPETGEEHGASATIMGRSATRAAAVYRDYLQTAMGDVTVDDITNGVPQYVYNKVLQNGYSPDSAMARAARGDTTPFEQEHPTAAAQKNAGPGGSQLAPQLGAGETVKRLALGITDSLQSENIQLQSDAQLKWDSLAGLLRGTSIEADLVDPHWAMEAVGADPTQPVSGDVLDEASPLRNLDPGKLALWRAQIGGLLANKGVCFMDDVPRVGSVNFQGLARYYEDKFKDMGLDTDVTTKDPTGLWLPGPRDAAMAKKRGEYMYRDLFHGMATGIAIHEVGHTLGMRHNFASSYDSPNYMPQYWQLRTNMGKGAVACNGAQTDANAGNCMGPRFNDPQTLDEMGLAAPDQDGLSNGHPGVGYFGNSTVMEYEQDYMSPGIAPYDYMYVQAVYGGVLQTYDIDNVAKGGVAEADQGKFVVNLAGDRAEWSIESDNITHYTQLARDLKVFDPSYCRPATQDELKQAQWRIIHGEVCTTSPRDHFFWKDFVNDSDGGVAPPTTFTKYGWLFTDWRTNPNMPHSDGHDHERWNYRYGETYGTGYLHTNYSDNGADPYEVTVNNSQMYDMVYPLYYFRRNNKNYMYDNLPSSTADRYFERARAFHWILDGAMTTNYGDPTVNDVYARADRETFNFLMRSAMAPEPGQMTKTVTADGKPMFDVSDGTGFAVTPQWELPLIEGRYVGEDYSDANGGQWDYLSWINHAGFGMERGLAVRSLLDGRPTLYTISRQTFLDGRNVMKNFRTDLSLGLDRFIGGVLSEDWANVAPWVDNKTTGTAPSGLPYKSIQFMNLIDPNPSMPANAASVFPNIGYKTQLQTVVWAMLYAALDADLTEMRKLAIYIKGQDGYVDGIPAANTVTFTDPETNFTYVAEKFGDDTINNNTVDAGIASRMLQHANQLMANGDTAGLRAYVGLIDSAHEVEKLLAKEAAWGMLITAGF